MSFDISNQVREFYESLENGEFEFEVKNLEPLPKPKTAVEDLQYSTLTIQFRLIQDGTRTLAQAVAVSSDGTETLIATGRAKRRKGDRRDSDAGASLALERCFLKLAEGERKSLKKKGL